MNPTENIPPGTTLPTPAPSAGNPDSGISRAPLEKSPRPQSQPSDVPAAEGVPADVTNLAIAAGLLSCAFLIFWMGSYLANHVALRTVIASFGTFGLVWVLYRLRVFQRPHGGLIVAGAVALFAAALPFAERGFQKLDRVAKSGLGGEAAKPTGESSAQLPVPTRETAPPAPVASTPSALQPPPEDETVRELIAPDPDPTAKNIITVLRESQITIRGKRYRIHEGSRFPYTKFTDGIVTFQANGQDATINSSDVRFTGVSRETPKEITQLAQVEAMRRYPALAVKGSDENQLYLTRVSELKDAFPKLTDNPLWPLIVADELALAQGWKRADQPSDDATPPATLPEREIKGTKPASLPPTDPATPLAPPVPPVPSDIPQEPPPAAK